MSVLLGLQKQNWDVIRWIPRTSLHSIFKWTPWRINFRINSVGEYLFLPTWNGWKRGFSLNPITMTNMVNLLYLSVYEIESIFIRVEFSDVLWSKMFRLESYRTSIKIPCNSGAVYIFPYNGCKSTIMFKNQRF